MKEIIFYDSGIGGIALLNKTRSLAKKEHYIYFADNANLPYGNKDEKQLISIVKSNLAPLVKTTTKAVVIGCNTMTSLGIGELRREFPETRFFGIEPEIKSVLPNKIKNALFIATPQTCRKINSKIQAMNLSSKITIHQAPTLASTIEREIANKEEIYRQIKKIKQSHSQKFDALILGCTHYALVRDVFTYAFGENMKIFDGINGTARNISRSIDKEKRGFGSLKLILSKEDMQEKLKYASLIN